MRPTATYAGRPDATYCDVVSDPDQDTSTWADFLRQEMKRLDWSRNRLATEAHIHRSSIFRWLRGDRRNLTMSSVRLVADALGVDMATALRAAGQLADEAAVDEDDYEIRMIKESGLRTPVREHLIAEVLARRERDRTHRREELARQIEFYRGASGD